MDTVNAVSSLRHGAPWWAFLLLALAWPAVYICRAILSFKLGSKALDKVSAERVPEVLDSVTGHRREPQRRRRPPSPP